MEIRVTAILWKYKKNAKGQHPIYIRIGQNKSVKHVKTGYCVNLEDWDEEHNRVFGSVTNSAITNTSITNQLKQVRDNIAAHVQDNGKISVSEVKELVKKGKVYGDFFNFSEGIIDSLELKYSSETIRQMRGEISKMKRYTQAILIGDVTPKFLQGYEKYMRKELGNGDNTVWKTMKFVRKILNDAIVQKLLRKDDYPFAIYKVKYIQSMPVHLTIQEVDKIMAKLEEYPDLSPGLYTVAYYFIFCCYSGIRYGDAAKFSFDKYVHNGRLILKPGKGRNSEPISIPIHKRLGEAIEHIKGRRELYGNQTTNSYLKILADFADIPKHITFHVARHTFAVHCATIGIPIETVKVLLGHKNIRETAIYYKITNSKVDSEMAKWG